jgi:hypothetical protein
MLFDFVTIWFQTRILALISIPKLLSESPFFNIIFLVGATAVDYEAFFEFIFDMFQSTHCLRRFK